MQSWCRRHVFGDAVAIFSCYRRCHFLRRRPVHSIVLEVYITIVEALSFWHFALALVHFRPCCHGSCCWWRLFGSRVWLPNLLAICLDQVVCRAHICVGSRFVRVPFWTGICRYAAPAFRQTVMLASSVPLAVFSARCCACAVSSCVPPTYRPRTLHVFVCCSFLTAIFSCAPPQMAPPLNVFALCSSVVFPGRRCPGSTICLAVVCTGCVCLHVSRFYPFRVHHLVYGCAAVGFVPVWTRDCAGFWAPFALQPLLSSAVPFVFELTVWTRASRPSEISNIHFHVVILYLLRAPCSYFSNVSRCFFFFLKCDSILADRFCLGLGVSVTVGGGDV